MYTAAAACWQYPVLRAGHCQTVRDSILRSSPSSCLACRPACDWRTRRRQFDEGTTFVRWSGLLHFTRSVRRTVSMSFSFPPPNTRRHRTHGPDPPRRGEPWWQTNYCPNKSNRSRAAGPPTTAYRVPKQLVALSPRNFHRDPIEFVKRFTSKIPPDTPEPTAIAPQRCIEN